MTFCGGVNSNQANESCVTRVAFLRNPLFCAVIFLLGKGRSVGFPGFLVVVGCGWFYKAIVKQAELLSLPACLYLVTF